MGDLGDFLVESPKLRYFALLGVDQPYLSHQNPAVKGVKLGLETVLHQFADPVGIPPHRRQQFHVGRREGNIVGEVRVWREDKGGCPRSRSLNLSVAKSMLIAEDLEESEISDGKVVYTLIYWQLRGQNVSQNCHMSVTRSVTGL